VGDLERQAVGLVRDVMEATGVSQSELARRIGVTPSAVSNALAGHSARGMTLARLERYLAAMGYTAVVTVSARLSS
jgi:transcriptional regulator with XRE-family HTH domain